MEDRIRRTAYSQPQNSEVFEKLFENFSPVKPHDPDTLEVEEPEIEEAELSDEFLPNQFKEDIVEPEDNFELGRIRERGFVQEGIDFEGNVGVEFAQSSSGLKEKVEMIEGVNQKMEANNIRRRYVLGEVDIPEGAAMYEDGIGKYYYMVDKKLRPSDVPSMVKEDSWFELDDDGRKFGTILLLSKFYPWVLTDATTEDSISKFLNRVLVSEFDELENEDVFSKDMIEGIGSFLLNR